MQMETVSGLDKTNNGYIVPVYRLVVHNISTVHDLIPRNWIQESWTGLKSGQRAPHTRNCEDRRLSHCIGYRQISHGRSVSLNQIFFFG